MIRLSSLSLFTFSHTLPHSFTRAMMQSPAAYASPEAAVCCRLFVKLLGDGLNEVGPGCIHQWFCMHAALLLAAALH